MSLDDDCSSDSSGVDQDPSPLEMFREVCRLLPGDVRTFVYEEMSALYEKGEISRSKLERSTVVLAITRGEMLNEI